MLSPEDQHGALVSSGSGKQEISAFGSYIKAVCKYLHVTQLELAQASGLGDSTISSFVRDPKREPSTRTMKSLIVGVEKLAAEKKLALPDGWQLELYASAHMDCDDGLLYLTYFRGTEMPAKKLDRVDRLILSMQTTTNIVRRRSRSEK